MDQVDKRGNRQLLIRTTVVSREVPRTVTALVDTGAQVNLIKEGLFDEEHCLPAKSPVDLRSISGNRVEGGTQVVALKLRPPASS